MKHLKHISLIRLCLFLIAVTVTSIACSTFYYGYSAEQWDAMTQQQQAEAKADYAQVLQAKQEQAYEDGLDARKGQVIKKGITGNSGPMQTIQPMY